jgi:hypothetical protein
MKKPFATVRNIGTRLKKGMKIRLEEGDYRVVLVNECRALCEPLDKTRQVTIDDKFDEDGKPKTFMARRRSISISPNSEVPIL